MEVSADGGQICNGTDVQQAEDSEEELRGEGWQTERHRQSHRWKNGGTIIDVQAGGSSEKVPDTKKQRELFLC